MAVSMKIGLFGLFGCGNSGNDGSLDAMLRYLRKASPTSELVCISPAPQVVEAEYKIPSFGTGYPGPKHKFVKLLDRGTGRVFGRFLGLVHPLKCARGLDLFIVPGTGLLDDFQEHPFGWPFMIFRWCLAARLAGAKVAFVSIGAGPIVHPLSRWFMINAARMCHYRSYRDRPSKSFMERMDSKAAADPIFPDLAFALPIPPSNYPRDEQDVTVAIGVMTYEGWIRRHPDGKAIYDAYLTKLLGFIDWILQQGHKIRLLTGDEADEATIKEVLRRLGPDRLKANGAKITIEPSRTLDEIMEQIAKSDIVVGTRFHNIVCALKLHRPAISLGYARKNEALLSDISLDGFSQHVESFDPELLRRQFQDALSRREELSQQIASSTERYARLLREQERNLTDLFLKPRQTTRTL